MQLITNLDIPTFDTYVSSHPYGHYMKSSSWGNYKQTTEHYIPHYIGMQDNSKLLGTALLLEKKIGIFSYFYIPWGMCVEYTDINLTRQFLQLLKAYITNKNAIFLKIDLNVERVHRTILGELIEDQFNQEYVTDYFKEEGFLHKGYGYAYNGSWVNRYTLIINIDQSMESIVSKFDKKRQNSIKNLSLQALTTRLGTVSDLKYVAQFESQLAKKQGFQPKPVSYFETLIKHLKEKACIYITEFHVEQYIQNIEEELSSSKYKKDKEALESKQKELQFAKSCLNEYGTTIVVAAGIFVRQQEKSWDLFLYSNKDFPNLRASDSLHMFAIEDMQKNGVKYYDMVGFSGVTNKSDPYYGLYEYKKSFGPRYVEYVGEFDYVLHPRLYNYYKTIRKQIKRVKRKYASLRYKK